MKLYISADMEGTAGICSWSETERGDFGYDHFSKQMTREVAAACRGALAGGVSEIMVKDAHDSACNINPEELPIGVSMMRSWEMGPDCMMAGITRGFDAAAVTGYHTAAYTDGNPLSHTMNRQNQWVKINGIITSEFRMNAYLAAYYGVPVIFASGDRMLCESAKEMIPDITTVPVNEGYGGATIAIHPLTAANLIEEAMMEAVGKDISKCLLTLPERFDVEVEFKEHAKAHKASFFPGAKQVGAKGVEYHTNDCFDAMRFLYLVL